MSGVNHLLVKLNCALFFLVPCFSFLPRPLFVPPSTHPVGVGARTVHQDLCEQQEAPHAVPGETDCGE